MSDNQLPVSAQNKEVRQWAMLCHFAAFLGLVFPFGSVLGPLILWQVKKDMDPLIDDQGKEALNFQLTVAIAWLVCFVLGFVVIGFLLMVVLVIAALVLTIIGGVKANKGIAYRYPLTWRLIK
ncbi:DUF4870 domain-containing protein [Pseudomonas sp. WS 5059]|jgi:uncharacterized Tic20 family protein|uniref:DUF4870 domain-containing protein n=1 Tax=Pseudomonas hygromyciniae TaxID=2812000 RepID=A0ABX7JYV5_9PSED|nr:MULTISPECIES: DUF4870 domain-containing protein [Pseudomonas]MBN0977421.1 DUF4870 domain-containing protein [Pseudomonas hygromyciniae]NMX63838.1 DUF4870 domain-containing protein [Pseudomonas sp. WS 5079]NMX69668.1 DUF4870 domain-containing protein [Pseudomonas sp. WS 5111]NMX86738.1 DUF4870 domain-containing protein [Pseudomonas sp. WS 5010]NMX89765.1 DUF4870 domain-containing protein [Pseudomonas sp. WS 5086]